MGKNKDKKEKTKQSPVKPRQSPRKKQKVEPDEVKEGTAAPVPTTPDRNKPGMSSQAT